VSALAALLSPLLAFGPPLHQAAAPALPGAAAEAPAAQPAVEPPTEPVTADEALIDGRRRPGFRKDLPDKVEQYNPGAVNAPPPEAFYDTWDGEGSPSDLVLDTGVPDRWRITSSLCPKKDGVTGKINSALYTLFPRLANVCHSKLDPFHHNTLKGDRPLARGKRPGFLKGDDWYVIASGVSDTVVEPRSFPIPVGNQTTADPDSNDTFGRSNSLVLSQTFIAGFSLLKGETAFKPPVIEYRVAIAGNINHVEVPERRVLFVEPSKGTKRTDGFIGLQEAFIDYHIGRFDTKRYDFVSLRLGIQPFQSDFRGFLFNDNQLGVRLFGNRDNNRLQFNLAAFWRIEKDANSGLNDIGAPLRRDWILTANLYRQDFPGDWPHQPDFRDLQYQQRDEGVRGCQWLSRAAGAARRSASAPLQGALSGLRGGWAHRPDQCDGSGLWRFRAEPEQLPHQRACQDRRVLRRGRAEL